MRAQLRICLVALALLAGCGQKGPLVLPPHHAKTPVAAPAPPSAAPTASSAAEPAQPAPAEVLTTPADKPKESKDDPQQQPRA
jgi:predicted small lipoprotein YifL